MPGEPTGMSGTARPSAAGFSASNAAAICLPLTSGRAKPGWGWRRDLGIAIGVAAAGLAVLACLRAWNAPDPLRDLFATFAVSLPFTILVAAAYIRHRWLITTSLSFGRTPGSSRRRLAALWPWLVVALVGCAFIFVQVGLTLGRPARGGPLLLSLLLVLAAPHLDVLIERRGRRAALLPGGELRGALWRTLRVAIAAVIVGILATLWLLPVLDAIEVPRGTILLKAAEILLLVLVIAFCWNWVAILEGDPGESAPDLAGERHQADPEAPAGSRGDRLMAKSDK